MGSTGDRVPDSEIVRMPQVGGVQAAGTRQTHVALDVLQSLPPEAIINVVNIVGDVLRTRAAMSEKHADFLAELEILRHNSADRERAMTLVSNVLLDAEINDEAKTKLVDTICQLALR
jgi:hypothetical protein